MSMFRLSIWLWHGNAFILILLWYSMLRHYVCSGHWHIYFLQPGKAIQANAQPTFLRCLWFKLRSSQKWHLNWQKLVQRCQRKPDIYYSYLGSLGTAITKRDCLYFYTRCNAQGAKASRDTIAHIDNLSDGKAVHLKIFIGLYC
jgi:hypothetical protein